MGPYHRILVVADNGLDSPSPAMRRAAYLAQASGASLHLVLHEHRSAVDALARLSPEVGRQLRQAYEREREKWLRHAQKSLDQPGLEIHTQVAWGAPHQQILRTIRELRPDLVIKDVRLEPAMRRIAPAALDWSLLRRCPVPLMLVNRSSPERARRIIAAVDPVAPEHRDDRLNEQVTGAALALARQCDATLHLAYVFEGLAPETLADQAQSMATVGELYDRLRLQSAEQFRAFAEAQSVPLDCRHLLNGPPAETLAQLAGDAQADVLVLGTTRQTHFEKEVFGSTAERILQAAACDVLAVKPEGFAEGFYAGPA